MRGRAALALAYEGAALSIADDFASQALAISDRPSIGRLNAVMAKAHVAGLRGLVDGAVGADNDGRRLFDRIGSTEQISDWSVPEWRMATFRSMLYARLGDAKRAIPAQETADRTRPDVLTRFATHIELHRSLMLVRSGERSNGLAYARRAMEALPRERHSLSLRLMLAEVRRAA